MEALGARYARPQPPCFRLFNAVGSQAFVFAGDPAWDIHFVPLREAVFTGAAGEIRPGFVDSHVGDEVVRGGERGFAGGRRHEVALEWRRVAAGHRDGTRTEAKQAAAAGAAEEAVYEMKGIEFRPGLDGFELGQLGGTLHECLFATAAPPGRCYLAKRAIDGCEHHGRIAHARGEVEHAPPTDTLLIAEDLQHDMAIEVLEERSLGARRRVAAVPGGQLFFEWAVVHKRKQHRE